MLQRRYHPTGPGDEPTQADIHSRDCYSALTAGLLINIHNFFIYNVPLSSLASVLIGCIIAGFFIGLDSSLAQERKVILRTVEKESISTLPERLFPITRKFTLVAITASIFVSLVLILVFHAEMSYG